MKTDDRKAVMKSDAALCTSEMISHFLKLSLQNILPYIHWVFILIQCVVGAGSGFLSNI